MCFVLVLLFALLFVFLFSFLFLFLLDSVSKNFFVWFLFQILLQILFGDNLAYGKNLGSRLLNLFSSWTNCLNYSRRIWKESIVKKRKKEGCRKLEKERKKESGCLIFECGFEAVRRIFWQKITNQTPLGICLGILLWIMSILTYSRPQTDNRSKSYDHLKFTCHLC